MKAIIIEKIAVNQSVELQTLAQQTFFETFADQNSEENMRTYLDNELSLESIQRQLSSSHSAFYFAKAQDRVLGYLKVNFKKAPTESRDPNALEIERIYVQRAFYGSTVGHSLLQKAIDLAKENQCTYIWLGVWEENSRAIRFYQKNGFEAFDKHIFKLGNDEQIDILMRLQLSN